MDIKRKKVFMEEDFLLENSTSEYLYNRYAKDKPIIDYHCHLPIKEIADNKQFENLTQIWLYGDHYKWRAMRTNGVNERYCSGDASDWEKFEKWSETLPHTIKNPLYHWTYMELKKPFGIKGIQLNKETAKSVWDTCNEKLFTPEFSTRGLLKKFNVEVVCTTDDPVDNLQYHEQIKNENFSAAVLPAFRPDNAMMIEKGDKFYQWFENLQNLTNFEIKSFENYIEAIRLRHEYFHKRGCRLSDHGIETAFSYDYTTSEINNIFSDILLRKQINLIDIRKFKSAVLFELGLMNHERGWVQQLHIGALRNNNERMYNTLGPDTGFDSIGDFETAKPLAKYLNRLDANNNLTKTIIYNINPADNDLFATMIGNFQDGTIPGKLQFGSAWWFLDQKDGIEKQISSLSNMGLLSRFVGMITDSRSFLSYSRHEYFRRILCNILGTDIEKGLIPDDENVIGEMIENICYYNAKNYFNF